MTVWDGFFTAQLGAAASLAGLLFVGLSINMTRILKFPILPRRAFKALTLLVAILIVSSLMLVPGQSTPEMGLGILVVGSAVWALNTRLSLVNMRVAGEHRDAILGETVLDQTASLSYVIGGITMILGIANGIYLVVPAFLVSFLVAVIDAWVLLVEINR